MIFEKHNIKAISGALLKMCDCKICDVNLGWHEIPGGETLLAIREKTCHSRATSVLGYTYTTAQMVEGLFTQTNTFLLTSMFKTQFNENAYTSHSRRSRICIIFLLACKEGHGIHTQLSIKQTAALWVPLPPRLLWPFPGPSESKHICHSTIFSTFNPDTPDRCKWVKRIVTLYHKQVWCLCKMIKLVYLSGFIWRLVLEKPVPYQKGAGERDRRRGGSWSREINLYNKRHD